MGWCRVLTKQLPVLEVYWFIAARGPLYLASGPQNRDKPASKINHSGHRQWAASLQQPATQVASRGRRSLCNLAGECRGVCLTHHPKRNINKHYVIFTAIAIAIVSAVILEIFQWTGNSSACDLSVRTAFGRRQTGEIQTGLCSGI